VVINWLNERPLACINLQYTVFFPAGLLS